MNLHMTQWVVFLATNERTIRCRCHRSCMARIARLTLCVRNRTRSCVVSCRKLSVLFVCLPAQKSAHLSRVPPVERVTTNQLYPHVTDFIYGKRRSSGQRKLIILPLWSRLRKASTTLDCFRWLSRMAITNQKLIRKVQLYRQVYRGWWRKFWLVLWYSFPFLNLTTNKDQFKRRITTFQ